jgi:hypothetical protein
MEVHLLNWASNGSTASGKTRGYRYNDETRDNPEPSGLFLLVEWVEVEGAETIWLWAVGILRSSNGLR